MKRDDKNLMRSNEFDETCLYYFNTCEFCKQGYEIPTKIDLKDRVAPLY